MEKGAPCSTLQHRAHSAPPPHHHCHKLLVFVWWWWHEEAGMAHHGRTMAPLHCCPLCTDLCIVPPPGPPFVTHAQPAGTEMAALLTRFTMALVVQTTMEGHGHRHLCGTQGGLGWGWAGGATTTSLRGGCWQRKKIPIVNGGCLCAAQGDGGGGGAEVLPQCGGAVTDGWMSVRSPDGSWGLFAAFWLQVCLAPSGSLEFLQQLVPTKSFDWTRDLP